MSLLSDHRDNLNQASTLAMADTVQLTNLLQDLPPKNFLYELRFNLPYVARQYSTVTSILGADYYNAERSLANLDSVFEATPVEIDWNTPTQAAVGYAGNQLAKGAPFETIQTQLAGAMQRITQSGDRETISYAVVLDPDGTKYERVPTAGACKFCLTMAAVAEVQRDEYFDGYHNFCRCVLRPVFTGQKNTELPIYKQVRKEYYAASAELGRLREEVGYNNLRSRQASKKYPELVMNTKNHLRIMRANGGV